jgi:hypothetical protein
MANVIVRKIGTNVEIRYPDVPLWSTPKGRAVMARVGATYFSLALAELAGRISDAAPVGVSGNLAQSFGGSAFGGTEVAGSSIETLRGRVFSSLPYAIVIDQGRRPGAAMPPIDAIQLWVERVMGIPAGFDDNESEQVAWAIAKSIAKKGIQARHFVDQGVAAAMPTLEAIFGAMGDAIAIALTEPDGGGSGGRVSSSGAGGRGLL